jgi:hypothetical protein
MTPTLMYVVYAVIILVILILALYFVYPTSYTLTTTSMVSAGGIYLTNVDVPTRTLKSSGMKDGVFYETSPPVGACQYALLVIAGAATDYFTNMSATQKALGAVSTTATPNVTASTLTYIGVFVSATAGVIDKDITATGASATTWLGVCDLTVILANLVAAGTPITNIGTYTGTLPTVNGTAVPMTSVNATSCASWPTMAITATTAAPTITSMIINAFSGAPGNGLSIKSNKSFTTIYDSIYYHKGVATSVAPPTPPKS